MDAISAWKGLFSGDIYFFTAIVKAHFVVFWWIISFKSTHKTIKPKPMKQLAGVYHGSIAWKHFVMGKTQFRQIVEKKQQ